MQHKMIGTFVLLLLCVSLHAQNEKRKLAYSGFSGGMLLHVGYVNSGKFTFTDPSSKFSQTMQLKGLAYGIGGQIRFFFGNHLRVGTEGYVTHHNYENSSYTSTGWGGILVDCSWKIGKFSPFVGGTIGGGSQKNITNFTSQVNNYTLDEIISYRKYGFLCVVPSVGIEYALNEKIHLVFKADYIFNVSNPQDDFVTGPRFYIGILFCK